MFSFFIGKFFGLSFIILACQRFMENDDSHRNEVISQKALFSIQSSVKNNKIPIVSCQPKTFVKCSHKIMASGSNSQNKTCDPLP
jgi:hypothetical protein